MDAFTTFWFTGPHINTGAIGGEGRVLINGIIPSHPILLLFGAGGGYLVSSPVLPAGSVCHWKNCNDWYCRGEILEAKINKQQ